jgi:hypothetical protein
MKRQLNLRGWLSKNVLHVATDARWVLIIVLFLSLVSSAFSIRYLSNLEGDIADLYENDVKGQTYAQNAYVDLLDSESAAKDLVIANTEEARSAAVAKLALESKKLQSLVLKATQTLNAVKYKSLIANARRDVASLVDLMGSQLEASVSSAEQGRKVLTAFQTVAAPVRTDIVIINDLKRSSNAGGLRAVRIQLRISLATTILILLVSVAVRVFMYRSSQRSARKKGA